MPTGDAAAAKPLNELQTSSIATLKNRASQTATQQKSSVAPLPTQAALVTPQAATEAVPQQTKLQWASDAKPKIPDGVCKMLPNTECVPGSAPLPKAAALRAATLTAAAFA